MTSRARQRRRPGFRPAIRDGRDEHQRLTGHLAEQPDRGAGHAGLLRQAAGQGKLPDPGAGTERDVPRDRRPEAGQRPQPPGQARSAGVAAGQVNADRGAVGQLPFQPGAVLPSDRQARGRDALAGQPGHELRTARQDRGRAEQPAHQPAQPGGRRRATITTAKGVSVPTASPLSRSAAPERGHQRDQRESRDRSVPTTNATNAVSTTNIDGLLPCRTARCTAASSARQTTDAMTAAAAPASPAAAAFRASRH